MTLIRVLVVDDSPLARKLIRNALAGSPQIEVTAEAANGYDALIALRTYPVQVVVTDLEMPGMGGLSLLSSIARYLPVVIVTVSLSQDPNVRQALLAGAHAVVHKAGSDAEEDSFRDELIAAVTEAQARGPVDPIAA
jgi:two-component system, chemotaxis family, protein-glutamate methylesterase/glutaminase